MEAAKGTLIKFSFLDSFQALLSPLPLLGEGLGVRAVF